MFESAGSGNGYSDFEFECASGVSTQPIEQAIIEFQVYPNPASTTIRINSQKEQINQVDIYNLNGQLLHQEQAESLSKEMDLRHFLSGMYYILINKKYFEKLVIGK